MIEQQKQERASTGPRARFEAMSSLEKAIVVGSALLLAAIAILVVTRAVDVSWAPLITAIAASVVAWNVAEYTAWRADARDERARTERAQRSAVVLYHLLWPMTWQAMQIWTSTEVRLSFVQLNRWMAADAALVASFQPEASVLAQALQAQLVDPSRDMATDSFSRGLSVLDYKLILELPPNAARFATQWWGAAIELQKEISVTPQSEDHARFQTMIHARFFQAARECLDILFETTPSLRTENIVRVFEGPPIKDLAYRAARLTNYEPVTRMTRAMLEQVLAIGLLAKLPTKQVIDKLEVLCSNLESRNATPWP